jgi:hypothetical protein
MAPLGTHTVRRGLRLAFVREAGLALLVAFALKFFLDVTGVAAADTLSWRLFNALALDTLGSQDQGNDVAVVLISDEYFEGAMRQASPLDRGELAKLIGEVSAGIDPQRQPVVAIDLDLSSGPGSDTAATQKLDAALVHLAGRARVILLCPFARTAALRDSQMTWGRELLRSVASAHPQGPGLDFATADLVTRSGVVMTYGPSSSSLGAVAGRTLLDAEGTRSTPHDCSRADHRAPLAPAQLDERHKIAPASEWALHRISVDTSDGFAARLQDKPLRAVFIGGGYALLGDQFLSAAGAVEPGIVFHAAIAQTIRSPVSPVPPMLNIALQVLGVVLILSVGERAGRTIFHFMKLPAEARAAAWGFLLWPNHEHGADIPGQAHAGHVPEAWLRWLLGLLLLGALLAACVGVFMFLSWVVYITAGAWFDGLLAGIAAWLKIVSHESQELLAHAGATGLDGADKSNDHPHRTPEPEISTNEGPEAMPARQRWLVAGVFMRLLILGTGLIYLLWKLWKGSPS